MHFLIECLEDVAQQFVLRFNLCIRLVNNSDDLVSTGSWTAVAPSCLHSLDLRGWFRVVVR